MRIVNFLLRFIVGGLFIFSGLIKINDPIGTQIKLEEYFEVFASDFTELFHLLIPLALPIAFILIVLEVMVGIAIWINYKMWITMWVILAQILFFTFLTFYSAYFNKVTDCGCFGDAIPLTPWESFYKDVILTVFILILFFNRKQFYPLFRNLTGSALVIGSGLVTLFLGIYAVNHLPYIDFRAYKIGDNIERNMQPEETPVFEYTFKKDDQIIKSERYLSEEEGYVYVDYKVLNPDKATPKIQDYNVYNDELGDYTAETFRGNKLILIIYDVRKVSRKNIDDISALVEALQGKIEMIAFTASEANSFEQFRHQHQLAMPYFFVDATVLKAMVRSNPGIVQLKEGTVVGKWHHNDVPNPTEILSLTGGS